MDSDPSFTGELLKMLLALTFVLGLMGVLVFILRRLGIGGASPISKPGAQKRLSIRETLALDARRRVVVIRRDDQDHLVILGQSGETVIETNIPVQDEEKNEDSKKA